MGEHQAAAEIRAAGAVLWRPGGGGAQIAVIHRPKYDDWSFPKGKLNQGEHVLLAAVREVAEETGLPVTLGRRLGPERYVADGVPKRVDYWAATTEGDGPEAFTPNSEVDELSWLPASAAAARLSYRRDDDMLRECLSGPLRTYPLILIRHASAGSKSDWRKDDLSRPLDARGRKDARCLARLLRCFGVSKVISSPAERCIATVRPFAENVHEEVQIESAFEPAKADGKSGQQAAGPKPGAAQAVARLASTDVPVVVCAHRENLPALIDAACGALGSRYPAGAPLRKAEFLVLHRAGGKLAGAERHHATAAADGASSAG
jgi:8-oxo-(d)GTP phosphatase